MAKDGNRPWREIKPEPNPPEDRHDTAQVWVNAVSSSTLIRCVFNSESGDWMAEINYCYGADGALHSVLGYLRTFYGNFKRLRWKSFGNTGRVTSSRERCYGLEKEEPISCPAESRDLSYGMNSFPIYKRLEKLPFARLVKSDSKTATPLPDRK